jgi:hypothetical protein
MKRHGLVHLFFLKRQLHRHHIAKPDGFTSEFIVGIYYSLQSLNDNGNGSGGPTSRFSQAISGYLLHMF